MPAEKYNLIKSSCKKAWVSQLLVIIEKEGYDVLKVSKDFKFKFKEYSTHQVNP